MPALCRFLTICMVALFCGSCEAIKVVTHTTSSNPIDAPTGAYRLDPHHWSIIFDVDHFGYSHFVMRFDRAQANLAFVGADPGKSHVEASIEAASIDSNVAELDALVKGPDMLDVARYPDIRFVSRSLSQTAPNGGEMLGDLTIHGETRPIALTVTFNGGAPNPLTGDDTLGFTATGHIDRANFGLITWFPAVGNDLRVTIQAEFIKPRKS